MAGLASGPESLPWLAIRLAGAGCRDLDLSGLVTGRGGVSGQFFINCKSRAANRVAYDSDVTGRLWQISIDLVGMAPVTAW